MEKEPDSMAVTMKQDYAASEVYSTTSEAPPVSDPQIVYYTNNCQTQSLPVRSFACLFRVGSFEWVKIVESDREWESEKFLSLGKCGDH